MNFSATSSVFKIFDVIRLFEIIWNEWNRHYTQKNCSQIKYLSTNTQTLWMNNKIFLISNENEIWFCEVIKANKKREHRNWKNRKSHLNQKCECNIKKQNKTKKKKEKSSVKFDKSSQNCQFTEQHIIKIRKHEFLI